MHVPVGGGGRQRTAGGGVEHHRAGAQPGLERTEAHLHRAAIAHVVGVPALASAAAGIGKVQILDSLGDHLIGSRGVQTAHQVEGEGDGGNRVLVILLGVDRELSEVHSRGMRGRTVRTSMALLPVSAT